MVATFKWNHWHGMAEITFMKSISNGYLLLAVFFKNCRNPKLCDCVVFHCSPINVQNHTLAQHQKPCNKLIISEIIPEQVKMMMKSVRAIWI